MAAEAADSFVVNCAGLEPVADEEMVLGVFVKGAREQPEVGIEEKARERLHVFFGETGFDGQAASRNVRKGPKRGFPGAVEGLDGFVFIL